MVRVVGGPAVPAAPIIGAVAGFMSRVLAVALEAIYVGWECLLALSERATRWGPWVFHHSPLKAVFSLAVFGITISGSLCRMDARDNAARQLGGDLGRVRRRWGTRRVLTAACARYRSISFFFSSALSSCLPSSILCCRMVAMRRCCCLRVWTSAMTPASPRCRSASSTTVRLIAEGWKRASSVSHGVFPLKLGWGNGLACRGAP